MKKISVIIPCYNAGKYIDFCMKSLISQTIGFENLEVILVDDKSTDNTLEKLMDYESKYSDNIIVVPLQENMKQGAARNIALQYASGQYVDYMDSDDYLAPNAYSKLYRLAKQYDADIVEYEWAEVEEHGVFCDDPVIRKKEYFLNVKTVKDTQELMFFTGFRRSCANKFYKREFILENNLHYAEGVFDEESLFTIMAGFCCRKFVKLYERLYYYFQNPEGTCYDHVNDIKRRDDNAVVWYELLHEMKNRGLLEKHRDMFEITFLENFLIRSVKFSSSRNIPLDLKSFNEMQEVVAEFFPNPQNNPLMHESVVSQYLPYIGRQLNEEEFEQFKAIADVF